MKKWHMEGIIEGPNRPQKKLIVTGENQMYLIPTGYYEPKKIKMSLLQEAKKSVYRAINLIKRG